MKTSTRVAVAAVIGALAVGGILLVSGPGQSLIAGPSLTPAAASPGEQTAPPVAPSPAAVEGPSWATTMNMLTVRNDYVITSLPDGRVLVAGGTVLLSGEELRSAELYDPRTSSWSATRGMNVVRGGDTATLLLDGTVLVTGGRSAEVYDPGTETWTTVGGLSTAHASPTATLLRDGRVLVAGSGGAEFYDPRSQAWTASGNMVAPRHDHKAILLSDGRVLAVGGNIASDEAVATAEIYDPTLGSWTATGSLSSTRHETHTLTLLPNGSVLVVGGHGCRDCGGIEPSTAELFDPATGAWTPVPDLGTQLRGHTATLMPDGTVLVVGGTDVHDPSLPATESFDPVSGTWTATADPLTRHFNHTATLLADGRVLVAGGDNGNNQSGAAELYDPGDP